MSTPTLRLRPLRIDDEVIALAVREELRPDDFDFCPLLEPGMSWPDYLALLDAERRGGMFPDGVAATLLVAEAEGTLVGRASIGQRAHPVPRASLA